METKLTFCLLSYHLGKAVNHPQHPDFVPSIFVYAKTNERKDERKLARFDAVRKRDAQKAIRKSPRKRKQLSQEDVAVEELGQVDVDGGEGILPEKSNDEGEGNHEIK